MAREQDAEHIEYFTLEPIGRRVHRDDRGHGLILAQLRFHADTVILMHRQEMPHDIKALVAARIINGSDIDHRREFAGHVGFEELHKINDPVRRDLNSQFTARDCMAYNRISLFLANIGGKFF